MKRFLVIAALLAATAPAPAAFAQDNDRPAACRQVPLSRVLDTIGSRTPGRHLNTTMGDAGGRLAYFVQWQTPDGRVVVFVVDACSGQVIGRQ
ncbi:hypothetical protein [Phenylobacterium sp.]|jgi:uncharacterized membrane protein YkoI|uniref:PepSY domain-containing protein n=1 Tax=Phenylobacterium sp. TaxID=1871053 RepID=UPI002F94FFD1